MSRRCRSPPPLATCHSLGACKQPRCCFLRLLGWPLDRGSASAGLPCRRLCPRPSRCRPVQLPAGVAILCRRSPTATLPRSLWPEYGNRWFEGTVVAVDSGTELTPDAAHAGRCRRPDRLLLPDPVGCGQGPGWAGQARRPTAPRRQHAAAAAAAPAAASGAQAALPPPGRRCAAIRLSTSS